MLREIVKPTGEYYSIQIPKELINKRVEILVLPFLDEVDKQNGSTDDIKITSGILKGKNIDPIMWQKDIRSEWER